MLVGKLSLGERGDAGMIGYLAREQISQEHPLFTPCGCFRRLSKMIIHSWPGPHRSSWQPEDRISGFMTDSPGREEGITH
jgi:hypothetical protein